MAEKKEKTFDEILSGYQQQEEKAARDRERQAASLQKQEATKAAIEKAIEKAFTDAIEPTIKKIESMIKGAIADRERRKIEFTGTPPQANQRIEHVISIAFKRPGDVSQNPVMRRIVFGIYGQKISMFMAQHIWTSEVATDLKHYDCYGDFDPSTIATPQLLENEMKFMMSRAMLAE